MTIRKPANAGEAVVLREQARRKRIMADETGGGDPTGARWLRLEADDADKYAAAALTPARPLDVGAGGEIVPDLNRPDVGLGTYCVAKTSPDMLNADASLDRLQLLGDLNAMALGADMAESVAAAGSLEKALAHQMAACHAMAMRFLAKSNAQLSQVSTWNDKARQQMASIEAARLAGTASRLLEAHTRAALTLQRLRSGGKQTVVVQHVNVGDGGQAVVAATVRGGSRDRGGNLK